MEARVLSQRGVRDEQTGSGGPAVTRLHHAAPPAAAAAVDAAASRGGGLTMSTGHGSRSLARGNDAARSRE
jgi:hypothetical protein